MKINALPVSSAARLLLCGLALLVLGCPAPASRTGEPAGSDRGDRPKEGEEPAEARKDGLVFETRTPYSHIRIRDRERVRYLLFVRDSGQEVIETGIDLDAPHRLQVPYTRYMFASFLFRPKPKRVLIVGLGGGAMVRFLNHVFPDTHVDAVEIDPVVVRVAEEYFGTRPGPRTRIVTEDAFVFFERSEETYDVIYMDAFLKPGGDTDATGVPLHLKTLAFYRQIQDRLADRGLVVFNLNPHPGLQADLRTIREAFSQIYIFPVPDRHNTAVVATLEKRRRGRGELEAAGARLDARVDAGFSFEEMARRLRK